MPAVSNNATRQLTKLCDLCLLNFEVTKSGFFGYTSVVRSAGIGGARGAIAPLVFSKIGGFMTKFFILWTHLSFIARKHPLPQVRSGAPVCGMTPIGPTPNSTTLAFNHRYDLRVVVFFTSVFRYCDIIMTSF